MAGNRISRLFFRFDWMAGPHFGEPAQDNPPSSRLDSGRLYGGRDLISCRRRRMVFPRDAAGGIAGSLHFLFWSGHRLQRTCERSSIGRIALQLFPDEESVIRLLDRVLRNMGFAFDSFEG